MGLNLIEFDLIIHRLIALNIIFKKSFESDSIRAQVHPQISAETNDSARISDRAAHPIDSDPKAKV
jgi:hypothetical protein